MDLEEWFEKVYYEIYFFDTVFSYEDYITEYELNTTPEEVRDITRILNELIYEVVDEWIK